MAAASVSRLGAPLPTLPTRPGLTSVSPVTGRGFYITPTLRTVYDTNMLRLGDGLTPTNGGQRAGAIASTLKG